ncbi:hypothetical protein PIB30_104978, partial [Stylosanthes scabra]|nr:hypothetical protein [Stylosanthes scabra]
MAGLAPEGSQFDARQFDAKMNELLRANAEDFFTSYDEVYDTFDAVGLQENLLRGYLCIWGIVPFIKGLDVIQQAQSGTGKTATYCSNILQELDYTLVECQALVLAPTRELAQQIEKVMRALGDYLGVKVHTCVGDTLVREDKRILESRVHIVVGMLEMLMDTELDENQMDYAQTAHKSGKDVISVISEVLDQAKIEAGKLELEAVAFDPHAILEEVISVFSGKSKEKEIE